MVSSWLEDFKVYDGQRKFMTAELYEFWGKQINSHEQIQSENSVSIVQYQSECLNVDDISNNPGLKTKASGSGDCCTSAVVYIDGSCLGNGAQSAEAGYREFWGEDNHPWNGSF